MLKNGETREGVCRGLAIGFGVVLAGFDVLLWSYPFRWIWLVPNGLAVALLWYGAWRSPRVLTGGWGFACAVLYLDVSVCLIRREPKLLLTALAALFALTVVGFVLSLFPLPQASPAAVPANGQGQQQTNPSGGAQA